MDIKIKDFEGPLDLLLHLVSKYQMDIYEVPLIEVIEQYLAYLATLQAMKLEVAGEYMLMASQLTLIKSRRLLPKVAEEMDETEDLEQDLPSSLAGLVSRSSGSPRGHYLISCNPGINQNSRGHSGTE